MGLDVYLYQFKNLNTDAILELSRFSEEPWAFIDGKQSEAEFQTAQERLKIEYPAKMIAKAFELGFSEEIAIDPNFGGEKISFPSKQHSKFSVGGWCSFSTTRELIEYFTGKNFYFVFPEAENNTTFLRPDWAASKKRLVNILNNLKKLKPKQIENFHGEFVMPNVPQWLLEKMQPTRLATAAEIFANALVQIEVMIETLDFVLDSDNPKEFLLHWSA